MLGTHPSSAVEPSKHFTSVETPMNRLSTSLPDNTWTSLTCPWMTSKSQAGDLGNKVPWEQEFPTPSAPSLKSVSFSYPHSTPCSAVHPASTHLYKYNPGQFSWSSPEASRGEHLLKAREYPMETWSSSKRLNDSHISREQSLWNM